MALSLLGYSNKEKLIKYYSEGDRLARHLDPDSDENTFHPDFTNPEQAVKDNCAKDVEQLGNGQNITLNRYFGDWIPTIFLFYIFLNGESDSKSIEFNLKTSDGATHNFMLEKRPSKFQPGNCLFSVINEKDENNMADPETEETFKFSFTKRTKRSLSYKSLIKNVHVNRKPITDLDQMQLYFLLCLEISRQLVDNALFFDSPIAALLVLEDKYIQNDYITFEDTIYLSQKGDKKIKANFKLLYTYQEQNKDVNRRFYRKQYEFCLVLALFKPENRFDILYDQQPNVLLEHFLNPKQAKLMVKYAPIGKRGQEILSRVQKIGYKDYKIIDDLNELNEFGRMNILYRLIDQIRENDSGILSLTYDGLEFQLDISKSDVELRVSESGRWKLTDSQMHSFNAQPSMSSSQKSTARMLAEVKSINNFLLPKKPCLLAILSYMSKAVESNLMSADEAADKYKSLLNKYKSWDHDNFFENFVKKVSPLAKGCQAIELQCLLRNRMQNLLSGVRSMLLRSDDESVNQNDSDDGTININIMMDNGTTQSIQIPKHATSSELKAFIFNRTGIAPCMQQLMFNSRPIKDSLSSHNIEKNATIVLMKRYGGG